MTKREGWNPLLRSYPQSEKINAVSLGAETLFTRLLAQCDDHANYYADPCLILAYLYGHRMKANLPDSHRVSVTDVERFRNELVTVALVKPYQADGHWYLHVVNCKKTLRSDIKEDSRFPLEPQVENWERLTACDTDSLRMRAEFGSSSVDGDGDGAVDSTESRERERGSRTRSPTRTRPANGRRKTSTDSLSLFFIWFTTRNSKGGGHRPNG